MDEMKWTEVRTIMKTETKQKSLTDFGFLTSQISQSSDPSPPSSRKFKFPAKWLAKNGSSSFFSFLGRGREVPEVEGAAGIKFKFRSSSKRTFFFFLFGDWIGVESPPTWNLKMSSKFKKLKNFIPKKFSYTGREFKDRTPTRPNWHFDVEFLRIKRQNDRYGILRKYGKRKIEDKKTQSQTSPFTSATTSAFSSFTSFNLRFFAIFAKIFDNFVQPLRPCACANK